MFVAGLWWGNLGARQPGRGVLQGQHSDHAALAWQLDPMDFRHQRELLSTQSIIVKHVTWPSLLIACHGSHVTLLFFLSSPGGRRGWDQGSSCCPQRIRPRGPVRRSDLRTWCVSADVGEFTRTVPFLISYSLSSSTLRVVLFVTALACRCACAEAACHCHCHCRCF
jgi:hypothetical protein